MHRRRDQAGQAGGARAGGARGQPTPHPSLTHTWMDGGRGHTQHRPSTPTARLGPRTPKQACFKNQKRVHTLGPGRGKGAFPAGVHGGGGGGGAKERRRRGKTEEGRVGRGWCALTQVQHRGQGGGPPARAARHHAPRPTTTQCTAGGAGATVGGGRGAGCTARAARPASREKGRSQRSPRCVAPSRHAERTRCGCPQT